MPLRIDSTKCSHSSRSGSRLRNPRAADVARAGDVLAVGLGVLVEALVVDGDLALELHVVERRHPLGADDRERARLVRVQPGHVQVRGDAGREAQEREHDVLDARVGVGLPARLGQRGVLAGEVQDHRDVVGAERPQRVLVAAQLAEVQALRVDVVDVAELAGVGDRLEHVHAGVVDEQVPDHQDPVVVLGGLDGALGVLDGVGERLLDEAVLARLQDPLGERAVRGDRRGEHDRVELVVVEQIVEVAGEARVRIGGLQALADRFPLVAAPRQLAVRDGREVAREVGSPVAEAYDADVNGLHMRG